MKEKLPPRIISLLASSTEIVCELGFTENLVGISHECDFPESIRHLPVCTAPKFNHHVSSIEIDRQVSKLVKEGLSVYKVDTELLEQLQPDFIVTQSQCEVCAVSFNDVQEAVCQLVSSQPLIINLEPNNFSDIFLDIQKVADSLGVTERGKLLLNSYYERIETVKSVLDRNKNSLSKPTVATIEWIEPLMFAGNWIPEMIEIAGGINLLGNAGEHSHYFKWEEITKADPDIILVMCCGFDITRTLEEMHIIANLPGFSELKAVKNQQFYVTDGNSYFNRPGPRITDSVEMLAEIFYPQLFPAKFSHAYTNQILATV
jgi:iron complex transport system substrate-binding protein